MAETILKIFEYALGLGAAIGIDAIIGKWVAYFTIAWENWENKKAKESFASAINEFKAKQKPNTSWDEWRRNRGKPNGDLK